MPVCLFNLRLSLLGGNGLAWVGSCKQKYQSVSKTVIHTTRYYTYTYMVRIRYLYGLSCEMLWGPLVSEYEIEVCQLQQHMIPSANATLTFTGRRFLHKTILDSYLFTSDVMHDCVQISSLFFLFFIQGPQHLHNLEQHTNARFLAFLHLQNFMTAKICSYQQQKRIS